VHVAPGPYRVSVAGNSVSYETEYVAAESGAFDIDVTGGALRGRAVDAGTAAPIPGVDVSLWPMGGNENHPVTSLQTGAQGGFDAPLLREGRYRVVTAKKGYGQQAREVELARGATADLLFELQPADGVSVKVTDARDGRTLEAIVVVRDRAKRIVANQHAGTDADGAVIIPLADGPYLLSTSASGYGTATLPITAPGKGVQVGLTPGGTLVIESPRNLRGRIRLMQPDGEEYIRCWCNGIADIKLEGRRTTVDHVAPGNYTIDSCGKGTLSLSGPANHSYVFYLISPSSAVIQETTAGVVGDGLMVKAQTGSVSLGALNSFAINLAGTNAAGAAAMKEDIVGQLNVGSTGSLVANPAGSFGSLDINNSDSLGTTQTVALTSGTLTTSGPSTLTLNSTGSTRTFVLYFVSPTQFFVMGTDSTGVAIGSLYQQF